MAGVKRRRVEWSCRIGGASPADFFLSLPPALLTVGQEIARRMHWMRMRDTYARLVAENLGDHFPLRGENPAMVPRESFNRWLFSPSSKGLTNELLEDIPIKLVHAFPSQKEEQLNNAHLMQQALKLWMKKHGEDEQTLQWCASDAHPENNNELRRRARLIVERKAEHAVKMIVSNLEHMREKGPDAGTTDWSVAANFDSVKNRFILSAVREQESDDQEISFPINVYHYVKCAQQFESARKIWDGDVMPFEEALFCLLCRYDALCGPAESEGSGLHGTLPPVFFENCGRNVLECFASPLNVWCPTGDKDLRFFCSFFDEDRCFGSLGSFFSPKFEPTEGLFELNPPFDCEVMESVVKRVDAWLSRAVQEDRKLAFIIALPEWQCSVQYESSPIQTLLGSPFLRATVVRQPQEHYYLCGRAWFFGGKSSAEGPKARKAVSKSRVAIVASHESDDWIPMVGKLAKSWALK